MKYSNAASLSPFNVLSVKYSDVPLKSLELQSSQLVDSIYKE